MNREPAFPFPRQRDGVEPRRDRGKVLSLKDRWSWSNEETSLHCRTRGRLRSHPVLWRGPALPPGLDALLAEAEGAGYDWIAPFADQWAARPFTDEGEGLFVVMRDRRAEAVAAITADPYVAGTETGRLKFIYVRPNLRGRGVAARLVRCCLERAGTRWRRIRLHTDNPIAARLYARFGFEPVEGEVRATHALRVRG